MDLKKVEVITAWPIPTKVKEIQLFLGLANFYRHFVDNFSKVAKPLHELTCKQFVFFLLPSSPISNKCGQNTCSKFMAGILATFGDICIMLGRHLSVPNPQENKNKENGLRTFLCGHLGGIPREQNRELTTT